MLGIPHTACNATSVRTDRIKARKRSRAGPGLPCEHTPRGSAIRAGAHRGRIIAIATAQQGRTDQRASNQHTDATLA